MIVSTEKSTAKPFLKWAGGKTQLLTEIDRRLPSGLRNGQIDTYVEPFIGGGALFFYLAQRYSDIKNFYLFDINEDLICCYNSIKENVEAVIAELTILQNAFFNKRTSDSKKHLFLSVRKEFNLEKVSHFGFVTAAKLIFLNKTCYNGLYRVNRNGEFNVPFGYYKNPTICDVDNLIGVSEILQRAEIICGDFEDSYKYIDNKTFVYLDPPYRPISTTASFTSYSKDDFSEKDQIRLAKFCMRINKKGAKFLLSNSDPKNEDPTDLFFDDQYNGFKIDTVKATRVINCIGDKRRAINELIITNY
ncbi:MAG: DNA adenine methylase [Sedimentisphaerales bacterium]|nr:DNA adenine methylase [Sedimentisphaerales bacterium]